MEFFKESNYTYIYDGTIDGLFTIVFNCYIEKTIPYKIEDDYELIDIEKINPTTFQIIKACPNKIKIDMVRNRK